MNYTQICRFFTTFLDLAEVMGNNGRVESDAHLHLVDLAEREPSFPSRLAGRDWAGAVVSHDIAEFGLSEALRKSLPPTVAGFGIHPQGLREDTMGFLASLAAEERIGFIGEAGFDFFGDMPERVRNDGNLRAQARCFEFQLELALRHGLPLLIHSRKATDLLLSYGRKFSRLPALIFHGWPGRPEEAHAFLAKGVKAYFSFGTTLLRDARHAVESCSALPPETLLSETDAPWQPPKGEAWTKPCRIDDVTRKMALIRGLDAEAMALRLRENFDAAFGRGTR
ncbi:MAG: TatD family hydrolase [Spirochaetes bacterium]|nr:TatD family hydrolase [Spirochaetota bacterium]